jgi:hypothetical protein
MLLHKGPVPIVRIQATPEALSRRVERWIAASNSVTIMSLHRPPHFLPVLIQQLACIDRRLIENDVARQELSRETQRSPTETERAFEQLAMSSLWVLGGFQLVYIVEKRIDDRGAAFNGIKGHVRTVKLDFNRLREPFAKGQPRNGDFPSPFYGVTISGSTGWAVSQSKLVSRLELSEQLLALLEALASFTPSDEVK